MALLQQRTSYFAGEWVMTTKLGRWVVAVGTVAVLSCSDSGSPEVGGPGPPIVGSLELIPSSGSVTVGATLQLTATPKDPSGNGLTGRSVTWSSSSISVAAVSSTGLVTGAAPGAATITATSEGKSATAQISVTPVPVATVEVTPSPGSVAVGATLQLTSTTKDASGNVLIGRSVTWSSSGTSVAAVSSTGLVTGAAPGEAMITATSEGKTATAQVSVTALSAGRSIVDRSDDLSGPQIHVIYVIPSDGEDRQLDVDGTLVRSVGSFRNWFSQRSNGLAFRFDTFQGALDVTFYRLSRTNTEMVAFGAFVVTQLQQELRNAGRIDLNKVYIVYYDGGSTYACGGAAWPPRVPGQMAAMYLRGTPGGVQCGAQPFVTSSTQFPRYWEFAMLHDLVHTLGIVAETAPNHTSAYPAHVPERNDLMYSGPASWITDATTVIDVGGDDYFGPGVPPGVTTLATSPFVTTVATTSLPFLRPLSVRAALELAEAFATLPPHPPFPIKP
jgi:hypothetical protein